MGTILDRGASPDGPQRAAVRAAALSRYMWGVSIRRQSVERKSRVTRATLMAAEHVGSQALRRDGDLA
jgi:hypothetical protein